MTGPTRRSTLRTALAGGLLAAPATLRNAFGQAPQRTLKLAFTDSGTSPMRQLVEEFAQDVQTRTGGAIAVKVFGLGELGSQTNVLTGLQTGIVDLAVHTTGFIQTLFPRFAVLDLPYIFPNEAVAGRVLASDACGQLFDDMPAKGIYGLSWIHWGWRPVTTVDRPVPKPADLRGMKIRLQPGPIYNAIYSTLGAIPVTIDGSEIYIAMSQRVIDATENPLVSLVAIKLYEVSKFVTMTNIVYNAGAMMASKRRLDALTAPQQEAIRQAARDLSPKWLASAGTIADDSAKALQDHGIKLVDADLEAYKAAARPVYDKFRATIGETLVDAILKQVQDAA